MNRKPKEKELRSYGGAMTSGGEGTFVSEESIVYETVALLMEIIDGYKSYNEHRDQLGIVRSCRDSSVAFSLEENSGIVVGMRLSLVRNYGDIDHAQSPGNVDRLKDLETVKDYYGSVGEWEEATKPHQGEWSPQEYKNLLEGLVPDLVNDKRVHLGITIIVTTIFDKTAVGVIEHRFMKGVTERVGDELWWH